MSEPATATWEQIREWVSDPDILQNPMTCVKVMQRGGYLINGKLKFGYGAVCMSRQVSQVCLDVLEKCDVLIGGPWQIKTINTEHYDFDPLLRSSHA